MTMANMISMLSNDTLKQEVFSTTVCISIETYTETTEFVTTYQFFDGSKIQFRKKIEVDSERYNADLTSQDIAQFIVRTSKDIQKSITAACISKYRTADGSDLYTFRDRSNLKISTKYGINRCERNYTGE